jgi:hypothetical protein
MAVRGTASRIHGRGALVRSLRLLLIRTGRYLQSRAWTPEEVAWAGRLFNALEPVLRQAAADPGVEAECARVEARARIRQKTPSLERGPTRSSALKCTEGVAMPGRWLTGGRDD